MFSPWYAAARKKGVAPAANFPALNVALYRPGGDRWVMTERDRGALWRTPSALVIGPSHVRWDGDVLEARFDEACATFPSPRAARLRGVVRVTPELCDGASVAIDGARGKHRWWPIAPRARAEVRLDEPRLRFSGTAYVDANAGEEPIEQGFVRWGWSRMATARGAVVAYHAEPRAAAPVAIARAYDRGGRALAVETQPVATTRWGLERKVACDQGATPRVVRTLEDTPFYARSVVETRLAGERGVAVHESLDATRFAAEWVRFLLPFRARRVLAR